MPLPPYAELHCHSNFSFLDGASPVDDLVERAVELGLSALAVTDHGGLYGAVRFATAAEAAGLHPIVGLELELVDALAPDPHGIVVPRRRPVRRGSRGSAGTPAPEPGPGPADGLPARPRPERLRLPGHRATVKEDLRGIGERQRGPHLVLLARDAAGYRSLCRLASRANLAGTKRVPRFTPALLEAHTEGLVALSGCREGEVARRLRVGDREGARRSGSRRRSGAATGPQRAASSSSSATTSCPTTTGSSPRPRRSRLSSASRSSSRTTSTTPGPRTASSTTSSPPSATAGASTRSPTSAGPTASRT